MRRLFTLVSAVSLVLVVLGYAAYRLTANEPVEPGRAVEVLADAAGGPKWVPHGASVTTLEAERDQDYWDGADEWYKFRTSPAAAGAILEPLRRGRGRPASVDAWNHFGSSPRWFQPGDLTDVEVWVVDRGGGGFDCFAVSRTEGVIYLFRWLM